MCSFKFHNFESILNYFNCILSRCVKVLCVITIVTKLLISAVNVLSGLMLVMLFLNSNDYNFFVSVGIFVC